MYTSQLLVMSASLEMILVPQISKSDVQISKGLSSTQDTLQDANSMFMQILQQSYILKYVVNSQMIAALMLIDQKVPLTYYIAQQVFSSNVFLYSPPFQSPEESYAQPSLPFGIQVDPQQFPHQVPS